MVATPTHIMKPTDEIRMFADKCKDEDPTTAKVLRRVAQVMDAPMGTFPPPDDE